MNKKSELRSLAVAAGGALLITTLSMAGFAALLPHQSGRTASAAPQIQHLETMVVSASRLPRIEQMAPILVTASRQIPTDMVAAAKRARLAS